MALRLPSIQRRPVENLAKQDPYGPLRVANARAAALDQFAEVGNKAQQLIKKYEDRQKQEQVRDAMLAVHTADSEFQATYGGKDEYNPGEVDDEHFTELADALGATGPIPAHQVYAEWRTKNYKSTVDSAASKISDPRVRENFIKEQEMSRLAFYADDSVKANKQQIDYVTKKDIKTTEESLLKKDYKTARLVIATSSMPSKSIEAALLDIDKREQVDYFYETIEKRNAPLMQKAYDQLQKNDPKITSRLTAEEQKQLSRELRVAIDQENEAVKAGLEAQFKLEESGLEGQVDSVWKGYKTDKKLMEKRITIVERKNPKLAQKARWALDLQPQANFILRQNPSERERLYGELVSFAKGDKQEYFVKYLRDAIDTTNAGFKTDAIEQATKTHFLAPFKPLNLSSPDAIGKGLRDRLPGVVAVQNTHKAFTGFGSKAEMSALGNHLENADTKTQMAIIGSISKELGKYASPVYEQLKDNGFTKTAAVAGQLYGTRPEVSKMVLDGARLRKDNPVVNEEIQKAKLDQAIVEKFGFLFAGNPVHQGLMAEAFKDVWAVTKDTDKAYKMLVGNTITLGEKSVIQAPPGIENVRQYERRLNEMPDSWWAGMKVHGYTPQSLKEGIISGKLKLVGAEEGNALLLDPKNYFVTLPDGITPFKFKLDTSVKIPEFKPTEKFQSGKKKEDLSMGVLKRNPKDIAKEKQKRAEEFSKKSKPVTKEEFESKKRSGNIGLNILKGFTP